MVRIDKNVHRCRSHTLRRAWRSSENLHFLPNSADLTACLHLRDAAASAGEIRPVVACLWHAGGGEGVSSYPIPHSLRSFGKGLIGCSPFRTISHSADLTACKKAIASYHLPDTCYDDACVGDADGWGERACAVALTVGLIFCRLFHHREKSENEGVVFNSSACGDAGAYIVAICVPQMEEGRHNHPTVSGVPLARRWRGGVSSYPIPHSLRSFGKGLIGCSPFRTIS